MSNRKSLPSVHLDMMLDSADPESLRSVQEDAVVVVGGGAALIQPPPESGGKAVFFFFSSLPNLHQHSFEIQLKCS